jgi:hypothetical protein
MIRPAGALIERLHRTTQADACTGPPRRTPSQAHPGSRSARVTVGSHPLYDNPGEFTSKAIAEESLPWVGMGRRSPVA